MLTDGVITLRPTVPEDAEAHLAGEDEDHVRWLNNGQPSTIETMRAWTERARAGWEAGGPVFSFAILGPDGALAGMIEANLDHTRFSGLKEGEANLSYGLHALARGHGYATRAVALINGFLAGRGVPASVIRFEGDNTRSARVAERSGYVADGQAVRADGRVLAVYRKPL